MSPLRRVEKLPSWLLSQANARGHRLLADALGAYGFRGYHVRLLAALEQHGPLSQAELGRSTGIDRSDVVATLDELATWGLARRDPDPTDRRRNVVAITSTGSDRLVEMDEVLRNVQDELLAPLSPSERATFVPLLAKLAGRDAEPA